MSSPRTARRRAQTLLEYVLAIMLIGIFLILTVLTLGGGVVGVFTAANSTITDGGTGHAGGGGGGGGGPTPSPTPFVSNGHMAFDRAFLYPYPLGIDASASDLILNTGTTCTIAKTTVTGTHVSGFGTGGTGVANGTYSTSARNAGIFSDGYLWVYDGSLNAVLKLDPNTMLVVDRSATFPWGYGPNEIVGVTAITADDDSIYLAGNQNRRIFKIDKDSLALVASTDALDEIAGLTTDGTYLYFSQLSGSDRNITKAQNSDLAIVDTFGSMGLGANQFGTPNKVMIIGPNLVILDNSRYAFVKFDKAAFDGTGWTVGPTAVSGALDTSAYDAASGEIWSANFATGDEWIETFDASTLTSTGTFDAYGGGGRDLELPQAIVFNGSDAYIFEYDRSTWTKIDQSTKAIEATQGDCLWSKHTFGGFGETIALNGSDPTKTASSWGGDIARAGGSIYVADANADRIVKLNASTMAYQAQATGANGMDFNSPNGIASDGTYVYVADSNNNRIVKLLVSDLSFVSEVTDAGGTDFDYPMGMDVDGGVLYLADAGNNRIVSMDPDDLSEIEEVSDDGLGDQLSWPQDVASDGTFVYVTDADNARIVSFEASGLVWTETFGTYGESDGEFTYPAFLSVAGDSLYIADERGVTVLSLD